MPTISLMLGCLTGLIILVVRYGSLPLGALGTTDFVQYWSAWRVILDGGNCYDSDALYAVQSSLATPPPPLIFSWNPPWTYVLLSPLLELPFEQSAALWMFVELALLCLIVSIVPSTFALPKLSPLSAALVATIFFPILTSIHLGQLGTLLAASVASFLFLERKGKFFWAGAALLPLTVKPHLFLLFIPPGIKWMMGLTRRDLSRFLLGALGGFSILVALTVAIAPASIASWLHSFLPSSAARIGNRTVLFQDWLTTTISTWVRMAVQHFTNDIPTWPLVAFPLVGTIASAAYFLRDRDPISWTNVTPPLLCLSLLMSNYGWAFDQSPLLICQIVIICRSRYYSSRYARCGMIVAAMSVQLAACLLSRYAHAPLHYYVWIPIAILSLLISDQRIREREQTSAGCPAN